MAINKIELDTKGIRRALQKYNVYDALIQYIWNGFDADANTVDIQIDYNKTGGLSHICIKDNGYGINKNELALKFKPIFESNKAQSISLNKHISATHGKNGVGRFTFFTFADNAQWTTIYEDQEKSTNYEFTIEIYSDSLDQYIDSNIKETSSAPGTRVDFCINNSIKFDIIELRNYLILEFAWYLELHCSKHYNIVLNGRNLDYSSVLANRKQVNFSDPNTKAEFDVVFCVWNQKLHEEYSKYYYTNSQGSEMYKENTTLNNKGDKFYHSVYIKSSIFNDFTFEKGDEELVFSKFSKDSKEYIYIKGQVDRYLMNIRNPFIKTYTKKYITSLKKNGAYPEKKSNNFIDQYRERALDDMIEVIYSAQPKIFSSLNITQQKTLVRLFDMSMQTGEIENLYEILESVLDMRCEEREELADLLKYTNMSNITKTIKLIKDRLQVISELKQLVLNKELKANERDHLQKMIENHYWIFGEQYHLVTAEEPDFEEALRRYIYILRGEKSEKGTIKINDPDKEKEMDIFAVQKLLDGKIKKSIVVELKSPTVILGSKELQQVKTYLKVIANEERFNTEEVQWTFYLVGNKYNEEIEAEIESNQNHGEPGLVFKTKSKKIYIKKWSDIFTEQEINYQFLQDKLSLEQKRIAEDSKATSADEIIARQKNSSAKNPEEIAI